MNNTEYGYQVIADLTTRAPVKQLEAFEVKPGDCAANNSWNDCQQDRERSELSQLDKDNYPGTEHWYGWSIYFPQDYTNIYPSKTALGQFHQYQSHPVWMFQNAQGGYHLDDQVTGTSRRYYPLIDETELRGKWHRIEVHARWSQQADGFFKVWVNGQSKVDYRGQTMTAERVYFKYGLYRAFLSRYKTQYQTKSVPQQRVYFANVKRSDTRAGLLP